MNKEVKDMLDEMINILAENGEKSAIFMQKVNKFQEIAKEFSPDKTSDEQYDKAIAIIQNCIAELKSIRG